MTIGAAPQYATDSTDQAIIPGAAIAYAVSDGYLHFGVVIDTVWKIQEFGWGPDKQERWTARVRIKPSKGYGSSRVVNLTKMHNIIVLGTEAAIRVKNTVEQSWVDNP